MKNILKLSLSLFGNQILASVGGFMCVIFVWLLAGDSMVAQIIFLAITCPFFVYIEYRAAFKAGFHNPDRRNNPKNKVYIFKGAIAGVISAIPLCVLIFIYIIFNSLDNVLVAQTGKLYARMLAMYYNWPMCNIFPNHTTAVLISSIIPVVILPMIGYIAGYKNFMISDILVKLFKKLRLTNEN